MMPNNSNPINHYNYPNVPHTRQPMHSNNSFAKRAARAALTTNNNLANIQPLNYNNKQKPPAPVRKSVVTSTPIQSKPNDEDYSNSTEIDKIVESVTNATKRLSQISTNTNSSKRKSKNHVGPWRLGRTLGRGSTGRVRLAKHSETGQLAAVKIVPKSKFQKHSDKTTDDKENSPYGIEREIIIMKLITHQNIMGLYDVWENKGELYLVLEYVEGGELFDYLIKKGKLPEKEAIHYFRQIVSGVSYCHQFNICHRDLKPENLLLDKNLNIKIADFGMAALELNQKLLETSCGSPHYASPEIVTGKTYRGSPSDVWSCGIILFALLTGHLPFDDENIRKLLMKVQSGRFVMPNYLSVEAKDLIWKMLKVNPNDRIKINDILKHPLMKKYETTSTQKCQDNDEQKLENYYNEVDTLQLTKNDIDHDLLKSLSILFHGAKESSLVPKLLQTSSSPEKIFYYLLYKYKKQHQLKEQAEVTEKNSKTKLGNGDGLLKKSKSTVKTTITNQDGTTTVNVVQRAIPPPSLPTAPKSLKRVSKTPTGQLQIPASSSYRRGVSFNNKQINNDLSRSSSRKSLANAAPLIAQSGANQSIQKDSSIYNMKKRQSILPPLPDLGVDWLNFTNDGNAGSGEFAALYDEIFNFKATPKKSSRYSSRKPSPKKLKEPSINTPPPEVKQEETPVDKVFEDEYPLNPNHVNEIRKTLEHTPSKPLPRELTNFEVNRRNVSEPIQSLSSKDSTLDPKFKLRTISSNNAEILNKIGINFSKDSTRSSKIYYSKSSTAINLASILNNTSASDASKPTTPKLSLSTVVPNSRLPPLPQHRISSNYTSYDEESTYDTSHELSFDFEAVPEVATAIQISNGSDITVGNRIKPREESIFEDVSGLTTPTDNGGLKPAISNNSIVKRHKKAKSIEHKYVPNTSVDIRGSLFNNNHIDFKQDKTIPQPENILKFAKPSNRRTSPDNFDESKNSFLENSFFVDNATDDFNDEFANAKRVTMIFDDDNTEYDNGRLVDVDSYENSIMDTPVQQDLVNRSPEKQVDSSSLKAIQLENFAQKPDGTLIKKVSIKLRPQRKAPSAPIPATTPLATNTKSTTSANEVNITVPKVDNSTKIKKSNWFTKFFSSLMTSSEPTATQASKKTSLNDVRTFKSSIPMKDLRRGIESALELKKKEGTLTTLKLSGNFISATIPASFALGKPLKFEIEFQNDQVLLKRVKGSKKIFKNLISAMEFVIDNESRRFRDLD